MKNEASISLQEGLHGRCLVGRQAVEYDVNLQTFRHMPVELLEETYDVDGSMLPLRSGKDFTSSYVERGEQIESAVSDVLWVLRSGLPISIGRIGCARSRA